MSESRERKLGWILWFNIVADVIEKSWPDLHPRMPALNEWRVSLSPPGFLNPDPDTCTLFAIAKDPTKWKEPAIYQQLRIGPEEIAACPGDKLKDLIKAKCQIAAGGTYMLIVRLNEIRDDA